MAWPLAWPAEPEATTWTSELRTSTTSATLLSRAVPPLWLIPTPNVQPNLRPLCNRERSVPSLWIPCSIRPKVLPKHRIALDRLECDPHVIPLPIPVLVPLLTLQKLTPLLPNRHPQSREIRPPTFAVRINIHHKRAEAVPTARQRPGPVIVVAIVPRGIVALRPHALDVQIRMPALEAAGAVFQAADCVVAVEEGTVGEAFGRVYLFCFAVVDN